MSGLEPGRIVRFIVSEDAERVFTLTSIGTGERVSGRVWLEPGDEPFGFTKREVEVGNAFRESVAHGDGLGEWRWPRESFRARTHRHDFRKVPEAPEGADVQACRKCFAVKGTDKAARPCMRAVVGGAA